MFPTRELLYFWGNDPLRIIAKKTLREFWEKHKDCEEQLNSWYRDFGNSEWSNFNEIKSIYPNASLIGDNRIVFDIKGNQYRLIIKVQFKLKIAWIRFIGTHAAYDRVNAKTI